jgi:hypothetical protein
LTTEISAPHFYLEQHLLRAHFTAPCNHCTSISHILEISACYFHLKLYLQSIYFTWP